MLQRAPVWMVELALTWEVTDLPRVRVSLDSASPTGAAGSRFKGEGVR